MNANRTDAPARSRLDGIAGAVVRHRALRRRTIPRSRSGWWSRSRAGGPADTAARTFGPFLSKVLGQNVVIENRPGASAIVGTESVTRAEPDGYTLLFGSSSTFAVNPAVMTKLRFDVQKDLKLIRLIAQTPHVLTVRSAIPANSLAELVAARQGAAGQAVLCVVRHRRRHPPGERAVQARDRHQSSTTFRSAAAARRCLASCRATPTSSSTTRARRCRTSRPATCARWRC